MQDAQRVEVLPMLQRAGSDVLEAVLDAHPVLSSSMPLGRKLNSLPPMMHVRAVRSCLADSDSLTVDATDTDTLQRLAAISAQCRLHLRHVRVVGTQQRAQAIGAQCSAALDALLAAVADQAESLHFSNVAWQDTPAWAHALPQMAALRQLHMRTCRMQAHVINALASCTALTDLSLLDMTLHNMPRPGAEDGCAANTRRSMLSALPALSHLRRLELSTDVQALLLKHVVLPQLAHLRTLSVPDCSSALLHAACNAWAHLTRLNVRGTKRRSRSGGSLSTDAIASLAQLSKLRHLDMTRCGIDSDNQISALTGALAVLTKLTHFDVSCNAVQDKGAHSLAHTMHALRHLELLGVYECGLTPVGMRALNFICIGMTALSAKRLSWPDSSMDAATRHMLLILNLQSLESATRYGSGDAAEHAAPWGQLTHMYAGGTLQGLDRFGRCVMSPVANMRHYCLEFTPAAEGYEATDCRAFWRHFADAKHMTTLALSRATRTAMLAASEHFGALTALRTISIVHAGLDDGVAAVLQSVSALSALTSVDVSGNELSDSGARVAAAPLAALTRLRIFMSNDNRCGDDGVLAVARACAQLPSLAHLGIAPCTDFAGGTKWSRGVTEQLAQSVSGLAQLSRLDLGASECSYSQLHEWFVGVQVFTGHVDSSGPETWSE